MAIALHSYKIDSDGEIRVRHTFYGATEAEADALMEAHGKGCAAFGPALKHGDTIEIVEDIDEADLPDADLLEAMSVEDDEEDDDAEPDEDDPNAEDPEEAE